MAIERIRGIVIDVVRHTDRHNVVTLYTRERGRMSFLMPVGTGRNARIRNARMQPLAVVEADIKFKGNKNLQTLGKMSLLVPWRDIYFNPAKSAIVMFLSEFLNCFLRQSEADVPLWDFIYSTLGGLDAERGSVANRHIAFLVGLLPFAGIQPNLDCRGRYFDMREGVMTDSIPLHHDVVTGDALTHLDLLARITAANSRYFRFTKTERRDTLAGIIRYYSIHYPGLGDLKSPAILAETFG